MKSAVAALITIIVLGMVATTAYYVWRAHNVVKLIPGVGLSEELGPTPYLTYTEVSKLQPGMVFETVADKQGWQIKQKDTHLYEKLVLSNIDLAVNDVVAWHGYRCLISGNSYLEYASGLSVPALTVVAAVNVHQVGSTDPFLIPHIVWHISTNNYEAKISNGTAIYWSGRALGPIKIGVWQFVGARWAGPGNYIELWVDGSNAVRDLVPSDFGNANSKVFVGANSWAGGWTYEVRFLVYWKQALAAVPSSIEAVQGNVTATKPSYLVDPTFYNGTAYFDIITGAPATPAGDAQIQRIPDQTTWLWLIKSLATDNKLHFKWFPAGTIVQVKDSGGNVVRQFVIDGESINSDGQVEDYAVSLDSVTIPQATVVAYVPALKVRVYAPYGAIVKLVGSDGTVYGEGVVSGGGYVDIPLAHEVKDGKVVVCAGKLVKGKLNVRVDEGEDGSLTITVTDDKGVLVPGMLVRVADPSNVVIFAGVTGQDGKVSFKPDRPLPSITVEVSGVWDGAIQYTQKEVRLSAATEAGQVTAAPAASTVSGRVYLYYALMGLGLLILVILVMVLRRRFL